MSNIIEQVIEAYGGVSATQARFKYKSPMCVYNWRSRGLPKNRLADIHLDTGIHISLLKQATDLKKIAA